MGYWVGIMGTWMLADAIASLYTYTSGEKAKGQSWLRDHSFRIIRGILGAVLIYIGTLV